MPFEVGQPIINSAYEEPSQHYFIKSGEQPKLLTGRRPAMYYYRPPQRQVGQAPSAEIGTAVELKLVNEIRERMAKWREGGYAGVSRTTDELIKYWRRPERELDKRLFFCQLEAAETIIFLTEARADFRQGLTIPRDDSSPEQKQAGYEGFMRYACKMATGTGKTTVMAMLISWSILNKAADRSNRKYSDIILVVCPNLTILERLQEIDPMTGQRSLYVTRDLVPQHLLEELRSGKVIITNWHVLQSWDLNNVGGTGAKVVNRGLQSDAALVQKVLGSQVGTKGNILVLNDEGHHAYRIRRLVEEDEAVEENNSKEAEEKKTKKQLSGLADSIKSKKFAE